MALLLSTACGSDNATVSGPGAISTLIVTPATPAIPVGGHQQLAVVAKDASGTVISAPVLTWSSSNTGVVTVSPTGMITGVATGTATIRVSSQTVSDSVVVDVSGVLPPGLALAFSTYIGGTVETSIRDVVTDAVGNIYAAGGTSSTNFPTTPGAYQRTFAGIHDIVVMKFSPAGQVIWSTLIGGPNYDRAYALAVDPQGNVYVAGRAGAGMPGTQGTFQPTFGGGSPQNPYGPEDGVVCKLSADGGTLNWCSYFGTQDDRIVRDIALDAQNNIFIAAAVDSAFYPAAWFTNSFQKTSAGSTEGIIAKIANDGSHVIWASYIGGSGIESGEPSIKVDAAGSPTVLYVTNSTDIPTPNGFDHTLAGPWDNYIVKFTPDGSGLVYGTYLGGSGTEATETHELAL
ncbi:MAG: SBBP repeat-containing protein, partial [Gemmatimonadota bacterium]